MPSRFVVACLVVTAAPALANSLPPHGLPPPRHSGPLQPPSQAAEPGRKNAGTALGNFVFIDVPGSSSTQALGLNSGLTMGTKQYVVGNAGLAFVLTSESFKTHVSETYRTILPAQTYLFATGVNDQQDVTGYFEDAGNNTHGFILSAGKFTQLDVPFASGLSTVAYGINNNGEVVGDYVPAGGDSPVESFTYSNGTYKKVRSYPKATSTYAEGLNNNGDIVGFYADVNFGYHGFILKDGEFTSYDPPGSIETFASAINDDDVAIGAFCPNDDCANNAIYSFYAYSAGTFTVLTLPWVSTYSGGQLLTGINDQGQILGFYTDQANLMHGFLAIPASQ